MIKVTFTTDDSGKALVLKIKDHGSPLVCASSSILAYTLGQNLMNKYSEKKLRKKPKLKLKEGNAEIVAVPKVEHYEEILNIFGTILWGYKLLEGSYPEEIKYITESQA